MVRKKKELIKELTERRKSFLLNRKKLVRSLGLMSKRYEKMQIKVSSHLTRLFPDNECTINYLWKILQDNIELQEMNLNRGNLMFTVESVQEINWTIWNDSVLPCDLCFLLMTLLKIAGRVLIGNVKVLEPFWNTRCLEMSKKLWLPTKTGYVGSDSNSSNLFAIETIQNSLFLTTSNVNLENKSLQKTSWQSSLSFPADNMGEENIENNLVTLQIKLYPTEQQRKILNSWRHIKRYVYNKTLHYINDTKCKINAWDLRNKMVTEVTNKIKNPLVNSWELQAPKVIRQQAVSELCKNFKVCFKHLEKNYIRKFTMKKKDKNKLTDSFGIEQNFKFVNGGVKIFSSWLKEPIRIGKRQQKDIRNIIIKDSYIHFDGKNYILCIPKQHQEVEIKSGEKTISLDPGFRTFLTGYDPSGKILEFHRNDTTIETLSKKIDIMKSLSTKKHYLKRNSLKKKIFKCRQKIKNIVDDLHWRSIKVLKDYDNVIIPCFENQEVAKKSKNKKLNRDIYTLSHFTFRKRLENKLTKYLKKVFVVTEEYTSKTCGNCGSLNNNLGSKKIFECSNLKCRVRMDRDFNGARNILLKTICPNIKN